jgi:hypothetical protein
LALEFEVNASGLIARLDRIMPNVREALTRALKPAAEQGAQEVRAAAAARIHYFGEKPGAYLASIYGGVFDKPNRVGGFIRSSNALAHLLEYGTTDRYRKTMRGAGDVVNDNMRAGYTGAMPAYPVFGPVLEARADEWRGLIERTVKSAAAA